MWASLTLLQISAPPPGLPAGWRAVEKAYTENSSYFGQTYIRYHSPDDKHRSVSSVNKAIELHAKDNGHDPKKAVQRFQEEAKREKVARERERGQGEDREVAVKTFRDRYGGLEATTCAKLEGWTYKTSFQEVSGQTQVLYISEKEDGFGTLKQVEAALGYRMMDGHNLDKLVADARAAAREMWGDQVDSKQFNPLRRTSDGLCLQEAVNSGELAASQLRGVQVHEVESHSAEMARRVVKDADYEPSDLVLGELPKPLNDERKVLKELNKNKLLDAAALAATVAKIYTNLKTQNFKKVRLVLVASRKPIADDSISKGLLGVYYADSSRMESVHGKPFYTKISLHGDSDKMFCTGLYLFWGKTTQAWKVAKSIDEASAGLLVDKGDLKMTPKNAPRAKVLTQECFHRLQKRGKKRRRSRSTAGTVRTDESEPGKDG